MQAFSAFGLSEPLVRALSDLNFVEPTPVQNQAIPETLATNRDLVVVAKTGTGKTAAFGLPLLHVTSPTKTPSALILAPTRELAVQIAGDLKTFAKYLPQMRVVTVYGGASISAQIAELRRGASIVVATPGRLLDLTRRKALSLSDIQTLVLDEADEILRMGFREDIETILEALPEHRTWLYSATMPPSVVSIAKRFMNDVTRIDAASSEESKSQLRHIGHPLPRFGKFQALQRIIDANPTLYSIIFCRTRRDVQELHDQLFRAGVPNVAIHGDLSQAQRDSVMAKFRSRRAKILVATDVAARGIDVDDITHVIHFSLPESTEAYTHRSGRTARAGKAGTSVLLVEPRDRGRIQWLERTLRLEIEKVPLPTADDVYKARMKGLFEQLDGTAAPAQHLEQAVSIATDLFAEWTKEELIAKLCAQNLANYSQPKQDRPASRPETRERPDQRDQRRDERPARTREPQRPRSFDDREPLPPRAMSVMTVNVGRQQGIDLADFQELICDRGTVSKQQLGRIVVEKFHTTVEVPTGKLDAALRAFKGVKIDGRRVSARKEDPQGSSGASASRDERGPSSGRGRRPTAGPSRRRPGYTNDSSDRGHRHRGPRAAGR